MKPALDVVVLGEAMLRLSPPGHARLRQTTSFDVHVCGSQGNIACNLARLGLHAAFATRIPDSDLGVLVREHFQQAGVDVTLMRETPGARLGVNYVEFGAHPRAGISIYDREQSAASRIVPGDFDWAGILPGCRMAYADGIFPALTPSCAAATEEFLRAAKGHRCLVAFDVNYRNHLCTRQAARAVLKRLLPFVDVLIISHHASQHVLEFEGSAEGQLRACHDEFGCRVVAMTLRQPRDVSHTAWNSMALCEGRIETGKPVEIELVDRFGGGDAWAAGFFYALLQSRPLGECLGFGNAMSALQQTIPGDSALVSLAEVEDFMRHAGDPGHFDVKR